MQVSADTQVKMKDAPTLLKVPETECTAIWRRLPRYRRLAEWNKICNPVVSLDSSVYSHPLAAARKLSEDQPLGMLERPSKNTIILVRRRRRHQDGEMRRH